MKLENMRKGMAVRFNQGRAKGMLGKVVSIEGDRIWLDSDRDGRTLIRKAELLTPAK